MTVMQAEQKHSGPKAKIDLPFPDNKEFDTAVGAWGMLNFA